MNKVDDYNTNEDNASGSYLETAVENLLNFVNETRRSRDERLSRVDDDAETGAWMKRRFQEENFVSDELFWADLIMFYSAMRRSASDPFESEEGDDAFHEQNAETSHALSGLPDPESDEEIGSFIDFDWEELDVESRNKWIRRLRKERKENPAFAIPLVKLLLVSSTDDVPFSYETKVYASSRRYLTELLRESENEGAPDLDAQTLLIEVSLREIGAFVSRSLRPPQNVVKQSLDTIDHILEMSLGLENALVKARRHYANGRGAMIWGFESEALAEFEESRTWLKTLCDQDPTDELNSVRFAYVNITMANLQLSVGDYSAAISSCNDAMTALQNESVSFAFLVDLANCALQVAEIRISEGEFCKAESSVEDAISFIEDLRSRNHYAYASHYAYVMLNCASLMHRLGRFQKSVAITDKTIKFADEMLADPMPADPPWLKFEIARHAYQKRATLSSKNAESDEVLYDLVKAVDYLLQSYRCGALDDERFLDACAAAISLTLLLAKTAFSRDCGATVEPLAQKLQTLVEGLSEDERDKIAKTYFVLLLTLLGYYTSVNNEQRELECLERAIAFTNCNNPVENGWRDLLVTRFCALHICGRRYFYDSDPRAFECVMAAEALVSDIHEVGGDEEFYESERFENLILSACLFAEQGRSLDSRRAILRAVLLLHDQLVQKHWDKLSSLARVVAASVQWLEAYSSKRETLRVIKLWLYYINKLRIRYVESVSNPHDAEEAGDHVKDFSLNASILDDVTVTLRILRVRVLMKGEWSDDMCKFLPVYKVGVSERHTNFVAPLYDSLEESAPILNHMTLEQFQTRRAEFVRSLETDDFNATDETRSGNVLLHRLGGVLAEVVWRDLNFCLRVFVKRVDDCENGNFSSLFETLQKIVDIYWARNEKTLAAAEVSIVAREFAAILVEADAELQLYCEGGARVDVDALKEKLQRQNEAFVKDSRPLAESNDDNKQETAVSRLIAARKVFCYLGDLLAACERNSWRIATFVDEDVDVLGERECECFTKEAADERESADFDLKRSQPWLESETNSNIDQFNTFLLQGVKIARPGERKEFFDRAERAYLLALCALGARIKTNPILALQYIESLHCYTAFLARKGRREEGLALWTTVETWLVPYLSGLKGRSLEYQLFFYHHYFDFVDDELNDRPTLRKIATIVSSLLVQDDQRSGARRVSPETHILFMMAFAGMYHEDEDVENEIACLKSVVRVCLDSCETHFRLCRFGVMITALLQLFENGERDDRLFAARCFYRSERFFDRLDASDRDELVPMIWRLSGWLVDFYSNERRCFYLANHFAMKAHSLTRQALDACSTELDVRDIATSIVPRMEALNQFYDSIGDFVGGSQINSSVHVIVSSLLHAFDRGELSVGFYQAPLFGLCGSLVTRAAFFDAIAFDGRIAMPTAAALSEVKSRFSERVRNVVARVDAVSGLSRPRRPQLRSIWRRCMSLFGHKSAQASYSCNEEELNENAIEIEFIYQYILVSLQIIGGSKTISDRAKLSQFRRLLAVVRHTFKFPNMLELDVVNNIIDYSYDFGLWNNVIQETRNFERVSRPESLSDAQQSALKHGQCYLKLLCANALINKGGARDQKVAQTYLEDARLYLNEQIRQKDFMIRRLLWLEFLGRAKLAFQEGRIEEAFANARRARHMEDWCKRFCRPFSLLNVFSAELAELFDKLSRLTKTTERSHPNDEGSENE